MKIAANSYVACSYDLSIQKENNQHELLEQATSESPMLYIHGKDMLLPEFEGKLQGLTVGDKFEFSLSPEQAYGERDENAILKLSRNLFEVDGKFDDENVRVGNSLPMMTQEGAQVYGLVLSIDDNHVVMDFNHPFAGETLHYKGEILEVHEATAEDEAYLKALFSGEGGCGCDCDCGSGSCSGGCH